jgi:hypothetical protein
MSHISATSSQRTQLSAQRTASIPAQGASAPSQQAQRSSSGQGVNIFSDTFEAAPARSSARAFAAEAAPMQAFAFEGGGEPGSMEDRVEGLYQSLLGRPSDPEGKQTWVNYGNDLLSQGYSEQEVEQALTSMFMQSEEYQGRVNGGQVPPTDENTSPTDPVGGPGPVGPVQGRPFTPQINPDKVGVVLNHQPQDLPSAETLQGAGVTGVRVTLSNDNFRPEDPENMRLWKERMQDWSKNGIHVTANLPAELVQGFPQPTWEPQPGREGGPVGPQSDEWNAQFDAYKQGYLDRTAFVAREFGQFVNAYEVWNEPDEPNNRAQYAPGIPAATFGQVLKDSYETIKAWDQSGEATVMTGGLDSGNTDYLRQAAEATGGLYADAVGLHPYAKDPTLPADDPNSLGSIVNNYSQFGVPIYITEASSPDRSQHAQFVSNFARSADGMDSVARSYFFWSETYDGHPGLMAPEGPTAAHGELARLLGMQQ